MVSSNGRIGWLSMFYFGIFCIFLLEQTTSGCFLLASYLYPLFYAFCSLFLFNKVSTFSIFSISWFWCNSFYFILQAELLYIAQVRTERTDLKWEAVEFHSSLFRVIIDMQEWALCLYREQKTRPRRKEQR